MDFQWIDVLNFVIKKGEMRRSTLFHKFDNFSWKFCDFYSEGELT